MCECEKESSGFKVSIGSVDFLDALTLIFITLKLCGVIAWPWWQVLSPFGVKGAIYLLVFAGVGLLYAYCTLKDHRCKRR